MSDEVNDKTIALCINGGKITAKILRAALMEMLREMDKYTKSRSRSTLKSYGRQSMRSLQRQNTELTNIEITDKNIRSFERYARKYGIDYVLKKDKQSDPPRYYVFFKARDVDTMKAAFKEYTQAALNKDKKPSIRKNLKRLMERAARQQEREKTKKHERDESR